MSSPKTWVARGVVLTVCGVLLSCGIAVQRDLSATPAGQIGFDDMCKLQDYFDALEIKTSPPPRVMNSLDLEGATQAGRTMRGGRERFSFENDFTLKELRRILGENWRRLPEEIASAKSIELEVKWTEKAGAKRVITDEPAELAVGQQSWDLPYQACLSELLYGEPLYRQRRAMWGLPLPGQQQAAASKTPDGGVAAPHDGGATPDGASKLATPPTSGPARDGGVAKAGG
jgi:hypothetical protein